AATSAATSRTPSTAGSSLRPDLGEGALPSGSARASGSCSSGSGEGSGGSSQLSGAGGSGRCRYSTRLARLAAARAAALIVRLRVVGFAMVVLLTGGPSAHELDVGRQPAPAPVHQVELQPVGARLPLGRGGVGDLAVGDHQDAARLCVGADDAGVQDLP